MNVIVEDDGADHNPLTERSRLWLLKSLIDVRSFNHDSAERCQGAEEISRVLHRNVMILTKKEQSADKDNSSKKFRTSKTKQSSQETLAQGRATSLTNFVVASLIVFNMGVG